MKPEIRNLRLSFFLTGASGIRSTQQYLHLRDNPDTNAVQCKALH